MADDLADECLALCDELDRLRTLHAATVADLQAVTASHHEAARELAVYAEHVTALEARLSRALDKISALREWSAGCPRWVPLGVVLELCDDALRELGNGRGGRGSALLTPSPWGRPRPGQP